MPLQIIKLLFSLQMSYSFTFEVSPLHRAETMHPFLYAEIQCSKYIVRITNKRTKSCKNYSVNQCKLPLYTSQRENTFIKHDKQLDCFRRTYAQVMKNTFQFEKKK